MVGSFDLKNKLSSSTKGQTVVRGLYLFYPVAVACTYAQTHVQCTVSNST